MERRYLKICGAQKLTVCVGNRRDLSLLFVSCGGGNFCVLAAKYDFSRRFFEWIVGVHGSVSYLWLNEL